MAQRLKIARDFHTRAAFEPSTFDPATGTVEVAFSTGARALRSSWEGPFYEELEISEKAVDLSRLNNGAPFMDDHPMKRGEGGVRGVLGVVERAWIKGSEGRALIRFSEREDVKAIRADVQTGILRHVSVGYTIEQLDLVEKVKDVPVYRATRWTPYEISQTPVAVDDAAVVRGRNESETYEVEILSRSEEKPMPEKTVETTPEPKPVVIETRASAVEEATRQAAAQREARTEANVAEVTRATEKALTAERDRVVEIRSLVRRAKLGDELADKLIKDGASVNDVRGAVLDHLTTSSDATGQSNHLFEAGEDSRDKFVRGGVAAIIQRYGHTEMISKAMKVERFAPAFRGTSTDPGEFGGMKVYDLARVSLERQGQSVRGLHGDQLVRRAMQYRGDPGMNVTSDFTILLETAVNKLFLGQYAIADVTWPRWCARKSVQDFRTSTFYRPGTFSTLDSVTEAGEVKHKNIPDGSKATLTPATKGNIIGISRRSIVNDDMGVFRDMAAGLGDAAARTVEADAFAMITANSGLGALAPDGVALFNAAHNNISATGAMSVTTLDSARAKLKLQKDVSANYYLNLVPRVWLGPVELGGLARQLNAAQYDPSKTTNIPNIVMGLFSDVIDVGQLSASSATRHYLVADPSSAPVFAVGFIDGQEAPRIETENSFEYDGVQMKVILDYGTAVIDYKGAATSAGV